MRFSILPSAAALLVASAVAAPAQSITTGNPGAAAQSITAGNPGAIVEIARQYGAAQMVTGSGNVPRISGRMGTKDYVISFGGCDADGRNCKDLSFWSYFQGGRHVSMELVNSWNADKRWGKAYIDGDGDISIEMDVNLRHGVARDTLDDSFDWWRIVLENAAEEFRP